jgi:hypothetical protein
MFRRKEDQEPVAVPEITFAPDGEFLVVMVGGGPTGKIAKASLAALLAPGALASIFPAPKDADQDYSGVDSVENFVRVSRYLKKGLGLAQIGALLNLDVHKLALFWQDAPRKYPEHQARAEFERQGGGCVDSVPTVPDGRLEGPPQPTEIFVNAPRFNALVRGGKDESEIAPLWKVRVDDLRAWAAAEENAAILRFLNRPRKG